MNHTQNSYHQSLLSLTVTLVVVAFVLLIVYLHPQFFDFGYNPYAWLPMLTIVANLFLLLMINRLRHKAPTIFWFSLLLTALIIWGIGQTFQRLSLSSDTAIFWDRLSLLGQLTGAAILFVFADIFVNKERYKLPQSITVLLILISLTFLFLGWQTDTIINHQILAAHHQPWGYISPRGTYFWLFFVWANLLSFGALVRLGLAIKSAAGAMEREHLILLISGILIPIFGGSFIDLFLPTLDIQIAPTTLLLTSGMALMVGYTVFRYHLFSLNPTIFFDEVLDSMAEGVVVTDGDLTIMYANQRADQLFGLLAGQSLGHSLMDLTGRAQTEIMKIFESQLKPTDQGKINELSFTLPDQRPIVAQLSITQIGPESAGHQRYLTVMTDITLEREREKLVAATEALKNQRDQAEAIIASIEEGCVLLDKDSRIIKLNQKAEQLLGQSSQALVGQNWPTVVALYRNDKKVPLAERPTTLALRTRKPISFTIDDNCYYQTKTGRRLPVATTVTPLGEGQSIKVIVVFRDISMEKEEQLIIEQQVYERTEEAKEVQARLQASINSLNHGFIMVDDRGSMLMINQAGINLICGPVSGSGSEATDRFTTCSLTDVEASLKESLNLPVEIARCLKEQKVIPFKDIPFHDRYLDIYFSPILLAGRVLGAVILLEDVTDTKLLERSKDEFFSIASHELRTPLTAIRGNTSLIKEYFSKEIKDGVLREMIDDIHESSIRLIDIVNDFLDLSRLQQKRIKFILGSYQVPPIIDEVFEELQASAAAKNIFLKLAPGRRLRPANLDRNRFKQVIVNLVGNAIKFSQKGPVTVAVERLDDSLKVTVTDKGPGIAAENRPLLFRKFQQASHNILTRDATKGTGLGLYISRLLMEGMGGSLTLERSVVRQGSTFALIIPLKASQTARVKPVRSRKDAQPAKRLKNY